MQATFLAFALKFGAGGHLHGYSGDYGGLGVVLGLWQPLVFLSFSLKWNKSMRRVDSVSVGKCVQVVRPWR